MVKLQRREKPDTKGNCSAVGGSSSSRIFLSSNVRIKKAVFYNPLTLYSLAIVDPSGTLYHPTAKHLFRNELIKL